MQASADARRQMGNRKFYDQMLLDACQHEQLKITDEVDVTTVQEYMQVSSNIGTKHSCALADVYLALLFL